LCEHRLERCLPSADRVVALDRGKVAFDGPPPDFLDWAVERDTALATPAARMFDLAGLRPLPVGVKAARKALAAWLATGVAGPGERTGERSERCSEPAPAVPRTARALAVCDLWVELDPGTGPRDVLRGIDLRVNAGERVALMGRNGAGKSTLLRCAAGLVEPARGSLEAPGGCALLGQSPADFLVRERVGDELPDGDGRRALDAVDLSWAAERDPRDLSGGERQRLALAIVMAGRGAAEGLPALICLDEPTRGMDRARKDELARWFGEVASRGAAVIVATHDVEFAATFAERVVLLGDGELIADGACEEVLAGGWYFATEVARILDAAGAITPESGAEVIRDRRREGATMMAPSRGAEPRLRGVWLVRGDS
jgi:energy-coupling factor transport system ATP-binding protein